MITPRFEISQSENDITIIIYAPYTNIKNTEIYIENNEFRFYSSPYYLRLHLPGAIEENDQSTGKYESEKGKFIFKVCKLNKGEFFQNLEYISTLINPKETKLSIFNNSKIEEIDEDKIEEAEEEFEWFYEQKLPEPESDPLNILNSIKYGFANQHSSVFKDFKHIYNEIIDLPTPDEIIPSERNNMRILKENSDFSIDHYLYDLMESEEISEIIRFGDCWITKLNDKFTNDEIDVLKELPNKKFILEKSEIQSIYFSLVDILFAWAYDKRSTEGESTCESSWTINKLSSTFSWLQNFYSLQEVTKSCMRRSLCYPLYRHYEIASEVLNDVSKILSLGKTAVIKCLVDIYHMFNNSEPRYIFNEIFLKDMIVWTQRASTKHLTKLSKALIENIPEKKDLDLNLEKIEKTAYHIVAENKIDKDIINKMDNMKLEESSSSSSSESSSESESSSTELDSDDYEEEEEN